MSSAPGPAYSFRSSRNGIVEAQYYIITFIIALVIQDYIGNGLELFVAGISHQITLLLVAGLILLLAFAFEWYATATGREDSLRSGEVPFEILRALFGLFALVGLHNFSLVLSRAQIDQITAGMVARQFGWGLAVVYVFYIGIRLVIMGQNYTYGENIWNRSTAAIILYIIYGVFWYGFANHLPRLGSWPITLLFLAGATTSVGGYFWFWQERYRTRLGLDVTLPAK